MNETARQTLTSTIHDLENNLRVYRLSLEQAQRDTVSFQAKVNHEMHKIAELKAALAAMDGENK